ncbi:hypothetical protein J5N97_016109 [Dioscorea zingiberensis]|uniref:UspA domain-containing protein n=1 Tax=Dioscorea zingiberensis TaxID=325984 RepID=A0A9D5CJL8_9LILI|nr:hypothetical protein J5N97_016109 [Dioscorea zingiberensis]
MKVMVAVDESEGSMHALEWTLDHLFPWLNSGQQVLLRSLIVLHVQKHLHHYLFSKDLAVDMKSVINSVKRAQEQNTTKVVTSATEISVVHMKSVISSVKKAEEQNTTKVVTRATEICKARQIIAETIVLDGEPKDVISHTVELMEIDLLVGSHGHSKLKRWFM